MSTEQRTRREAGITDDIQLITVRIEGQLIGLPITSVRDVFSISAMTPVPRADRAVAGLVNLRGHIVTILDLGYLLNSRKSARKSEQEPMAVGVEWQGEVFGLVVDEMVMCCRFPANPASNAGQYGHQLGPVHTPRSQTGAGADD